MGARAIPATATSPLAPTPATIAPQQQNHASISQQQQQQPQRGECTCNCCGAAFRRDQNNNASRPSFGMSTNCVAFLPAQYAHREWSCAACGLEHTVALPRCLVCRRPAPRHHSDASSSSAALPSSDGGSGHWARAGETTASFLTSLIPSALTTGGTKRDATPQQQQREVTNAPRYANGGYHHTTAASHNNNNYVDPNVYGAAAAHSPPPFEAASIGGHHYYYDSDAALAAVLSSSAADAEAMEALGSPARAIDELLANIGAERQEQIGDGNCLFRSLAHQLFGQQDAHALVRELCCDFIEAHAADYAELVEASAVGVGSPTSIPSSYASRVAGGVSDEKGGCVTDRNIVAFSQYVARMRMAGTWGDEICVHAAARLFTVRIHVLTSDYPNSRWHLVFQPELADRCGGGGGEKSSSGAKATAGAGGRQPSSVGGFDYCGDAHEEVDDINTYFPDPNALEKKEKKATTATTTAATHSSSSSSSKKKKASLPRARVSDIFLLYLRPVHYDDIVNPPLVRSVMDHLAETLHIELATEDEWDDAEADV